MTKNQNIHRGFDAGNYCNAYETQDLDEAMAHRDAIRSEWYRTAFILGFFSSYELHEIPDRFRPVYLEAYKSPAGQRTLALSLIDKRTT